MAFKFSLKIKGEGSSNGHYYVGKDGVAFKNLLIGGIEERVLNLEGKMLAAKGLEASERILKLHAIFFQRIISRTPRDESYHWIDAKGNLKHHKDDKDYIQDYWTITYNNMRITAKYLKDSCGCTFDKFNDKEEIEVIYKEFKKFLGKKSSSYWSGGKTIRALTVFNDYPKDKQHELRYHLLEFGGYMGDGIIKHNNRPHGVVGGHSIQAPAGMTALTEAEFKNGSFNVATNKLTSHLGNVQKVKSYSRLKTLLKGKVKFTQDDLAKIMEEYGV